MQETKMDSSVQTNRQYKDRLFLLLFGTEKCKKHLLDLYNALSDSNYDNVDDLELTTIEDAIYMKMKNDVSFIMNGVMSLYEQQSSYNPNMPLRGLEYCANLYEKWIADKNIYGRKLVKIPTPNCIVFYNGIEERPEREVLHLSDAFEIPTTGYEWTTTVINLNKGYNENIKDKCYMLERYSSFVALVYDKIKEYKDTKRAIDEAVDIFIEQGGEFGMILLEHKAEVMNMCLTEFNEELYEKDLREWALEEGREAGIKLTKLVLKLDAQGYAVSDIATEAQISVEEVKKILED